MRVRESESEIDMSSSTPTRISGLFHLRFVNSIITIDFIVQSLSRSGNNKCNNNNGFNSLQISYFVANGWWWVKKVYRYQIDRYIYRASSHTHSETETDRVSKLGLLHFSRAESSHEIPKMLLSNLISAFVVLSISFFLFAICTWHGQQQHELRLQQQQQQLSLYVLHAPFAFFYFVVGHSYLEGFLSTNFSLRGKIVAMSSLCLVPFLCVVSQRILRSFPSCSAPQESRFATNSTHMYRDG